MNISPVFQKPKEWIGSTYQRLGKKRFFVRLIGVIIALFIVLKIIIGIATPEQFTTIIPTRQDVVEVVTLVGRVRSRDRAELAFNASGRIADIMVDEGDAVKAGQELARLSLQDRYAELANARASLKLVQADANAGASDVGTAQRQLDTTKKQQDILVANAWRELLSNDLQAYPVKFSTDASAPIISGVYHDNEVGEYNLDVYNSGGESGFSINVSGLESITEGGYLTSAGPLGTRGLYMQFNEDDRLRYGNTDWVIPIPNTRSSTYASARSAYDSAIATRDKTIAAAEDALQRSQLLESSAVGASSRSSALIDQSRARVQQAAASVAQGIITAPFDGVVGSLLFKKGENVTAGETVLSIINENTYEIILDVPEIDIGKVVVGNIVAIELDAYPEESWQGMITKISPVESYVDGVPVYSVTALIQNPDDHIRSGMSGHATIETQRIVGALAIPLSSLSFKDDQAMVEVLRDAEKVFIPVTLGLRGTDGVVEILSGISEKDQIIMSGEDL